MLSQVGLNAALGVLSGTGQHASVSLPVAGVVKVLVEVCETWLLAQQPMCS